MGADVIKVATSGGVLSPRDDPRHAHFRPAELEVLVEEATAAGHVRDGPRPGRRRHQERDPGRDPLDRPRDLPRRRGDRADARRAGPGSCRRSSPRRASSTRSTPASSCRRRSSTRRGCVVEIHRAAFRRAVEAGVRIAMGTDSGVTPHGRNLRELAAHGRGRDDAGGGRSRRRRGARPSCMGLDDELGTIEPGKLADLVVVEGDPYDVATLARSGRAGLEGRRPGDLIGSVCPRGRVSPDPGTVPGGALPGVGGPPCRPRRTRPQKECPHEAHRRSRRPVRARHGGRRRGGPRREAADRPDRRPRGRRGRARRDLRPGHVPQHRDGVPRWHARLLVRRRDRRPARRDARPGRRPPRGQGRVRRRADPRPVVVASRVERERRRARPRTCGRRPTGR